MGPFRFPSEWGTCRSFLRTFDLGELYPLQSWIPRIRWCVNNGFPFPPDLSRAAVAPLPRNSPDFSPQPQLRLLWRSSVVARPDPSAETTAQLTGASSCAETFLQTLKATDVRPSQAAKMVTLSWKRIRLTRTFRHMGPSAKLKAPRKEGTPLSAANAFFPKLVSIQHLARGSPLLPLLLLRGQAVFQLLRA